MPCVVNKIPKTLINKKFYVCFFVYIFSRILSKPTTGPVMAATKYEPVLDIEQHVVIDHEGHFRQASWGQQAAGPGA